MNDHRRIDARSLAMAQAIVHHIDADPQRAGLQTARAVLAHWRKAHDLTVMNEWERILERPWNEIRHVLLDEGEEGARLRQSSPFCQRLSNRERWRSLIRHGFVLPDELEDLLTRVPPAYQIDVGARLRRCLEEMEDS